MYNNILMEANYYKVGLYIRLSEADIDKSYESESESVINQRNLLLNYVKQNGFDLIDQYVDDGYTGTNFDRPGFKRLINDIELGKINCVITKDLSRLGRDYIKCGYYIEQYFPSKKIRYISILDQIDTFLDSANNDIAPFKALFNDMTSKDTSKKIRSILKNKKEQGKFIGSSPCYGYIRDPLDKGHLIINNACAWIVKKIFKMASEGIGVSKIVFYLNNNNIKTPSALKGKSNFNNLWTISSVNKILKNRMYTGDMVQNMQTKLSYKSQKKITLEKSFWIIVPNTHEALVSKELFEEIQNNLKRTNKTFKNREKRLLENLIYCKECGNTLSVAYHKNKNYWTINCNKYSRNPKLRLCEPHFFNYDKLEKTILNKLEKTYQKYLNKIDINLMAKKIYQENKIKNKNEEIKYLNFRIKELQSKIDMLYEDRFKGNISLITYKRLAKENENVVLNLKYQLKELNNKEQKIKSVDDYKNIINNLNRELLKNIVDKIYIDKNKNIEIIYSFREL